MHFWLPHGFHHNRFRAHFRGKRRLVALPLLPVSAYAQATDDPAVEAYEEWRKLDAGCKRMHGVYGELEDRHGPLAKEAEAYRDEFLSPACDRRRANEERISEMVATIPAGLAGQWRSAVGIYGCGEGEACYDLEDGLLLAALAGAERIAGEGV